MDLSCRTDLPLDEFQLDAVIRWVNTLIAGILLYEGTSGKTEEPVVDG